MEQRVTPGTRPPAPGAGAFNELEALFVSSSFLIHHHHPVDISYLTRVIMGKLKAVIDGLGLVSIALGMVPGVGENLKSAAELLSKICEQVQVRPSSLSDVNSLSSRGLPSLQNMKENREGYEQLGVQAAELIAAVTSALKQHEQDDMLVRAMQPNVEKLQKYA
jgi:hypothetical protein